MVRKPNKMYRNVNGPAYTRREYMGGVPHVRIQQFVMGNVHGDFDTELQLRVKEACHIRHIALEAARISISRFMAKSVPGGNYYVKFRVYPHHIIREHKMATGAGADRISSGMSHAFGKPVGTAARVKPGQIIVTIKVNSQNAQSISKAHDALRKAGMKLPSPVHIDVVPLK